MNEDGVELEKLETLDGPPREIIRKNDEVYCYFPRAKTVRLERTNTRKFFPSLLSAPVEQLKDVYQPRLGGPDRVAGYDCQLVLLMPRDQMRFAHRFCIEVNSGLLLDAARIDSKDTVVERFAFTDVSIGRSVSKDAIKPTRPDSERAQESSQESRASDGSWYVSDVPPGFAKVLDLQRRMPGRRAPVTHMLFSDGLSMISVFVEPQREAIPPAAPTSRGSMAMYTRQVNDWRITVLGEVPVQSVLRIGNSVQARK
jgi:sigma-E factor negative regulatory protein RseB